MVIILKIITLTTFFLCLQAEAALRGAARERLPSDPPPPPPPAPPTQDKSVSSLPPHLMGTPYPFGLSPSAVMQDPRLQALK